MARPDREDCPWLAVEGWKTVRDLSERQAPELLIYADSDDPRLPSLLQKSKEAVEVTPDLFRRLSQVQHPQFILAFFSKPRWTWKQISPYVLYLDRLQDPGNFGTLIRTAAATGIFSVVASPGTVSCFNDKVVRASASCLLTSPFLQGVPFDELLKRNFTLWTTATTGGQNLFEADFTSPLAVTIGGEATGIDESIQAAATHRITIPMAAGVDSLNAGVAGSLIMYEVLRKQSQNE